SVAVRRTPAVPTTRRARPAGPGGSACWWLPDPQLLPPPIAAMYLQRQDLVAAHPNDQVVAGRVPAGEDVRHQLPDDGRLQPGLRVLAGVIAFPHGRVHPARGDGV